MGKNHNTLNISVEVVENNVTIDDVIKTRALSANQVDAFYVVDVADIVAKYHRWRSHLPRVEPYYAVNCNNDGTLLQLLADLGVNFACTSKNEIQTVLSMGVPASQLMYANPCKPKSHVQYSARANVNLMTFDNEQELYKVKREFPDARLVIRLCVDEAVADDVPVGMKFGVTPDQVFPLLCVAKTLQLDVVGVSFHVDSDTYSSAIKQAYTVFNTAAAMGFTFDIVDIGGGFPGSTGDVARFQEIAADVTDSLEEYFPPESGVRVIAEPGKYFVSSAFTLVVSVTAEHCVTPGTDSYVYYVNDGVFGSFNSVLYDDRVLTPRLLRDTDQCEPLVNCSLRGPSYDRQDQITGQLTLPRLTPGDWLSFRDMGAYTLCAFSPFNDLPKPQCHYIIPEAIQDFLSVEDGTTLQVSPLTPVTTA